jgi:hypothetical protein
MELLRYSEAVLVPTDVLRSIRRAQSADGANKYNVYEILASATKLGEKDALYWIAKYPELYLRGVVNGFIEGKPLTSSAEE